ncbi:GNAT family N-acetyltransferase [Pseudonocardia nigra]|uniref:GNAT family N-acetyltransferase n=1 Tax=Pseudonocardia nigra TaxID=1921578 RepID=UPI001C5EFEF6|nr:GNAT family N-acetyltransferase [Pseudonocardia nigra]
MTTVTPPLVLEPVLADDEGALREWFELAAAAQAHDVPAGPPPCWVAHRTQLSVPWPGEETSAWLARSDGALVGVVELTLPTLDNLDTALGQIVVAPEHRRRGIGRHLLAHLTDQARAAGRVRLIGEAHAPLDGPGSGGPFAAAAGAREALLDVRRRLALPVDEALLDRLEAEARARAADYELEQWTGDTPPQWRAEIARLTARMSTDAPLGELAWQPEHHDAQRVAGRDAMCRARGYRMTLTAARHGDRLVGFSEIAVTTSYPQHASQWDTIVDPDHRGHRLGMLLKVANLRLAQEQHPEMRTVDTYNAASNSYMIAINEAMGFRPLDRLGEWQLELG